MRTDQPARWSRNRWFYVSAVLGFLLFVTLCTYPTDSGDSAPAPTPNPPPADASPVPTSTPPPASDSPTPPPVVASPNPVETNPLVASFTGQELHDCLTAPTTPVAERVGCQDAADLATLDAVLRTGGESPTQEQRELDLAIKQADGLYEEIGDVLRDTDGLSAYCAGALARHQAQFQTLQDYLVSVDPPLLYLDYRLAAVDFFLGDLAAACT